ncbi:MAG: patatin-like phospholipase family protein [Burkholderiaceae bacterium]
MPPRVSGAVAPATRIALALGTGSIHGIVHIGVLRACERHGFRPDLVVGTSAGAVVGAIWAAGRPADSMRDLAGRMNWWELASPPSSLRGLSSSRELIRIVREATGNRTIEQLERPFAAVATDLATGSRVVLSTGDAATAVAASACVPVLFEPVTINGVTLIDGALTEPVPVRTARELGATRVLAVDVQYRPHEGPVGRLVSIGFQAMQILVASLTEAQIREADLSIRLDVHRLMAGTDFADSLIAAGEQAFDDVWPALRRWASERGP